jgi:hypothetical protein
MAIVAVTVTVIVMTMVIMVIITQQPRADEVHR